MSRSSAPIARPADYTAIQTEKCTKFSVTFNNWTIMDHQRPRRRIMYIAPIRRQIGSIIAQEDECHDRRCARGKWNDDRARQRILSILSVEHPRWCSRVTMQNTSMNDFVTNPTRMDRHGERPDDLGAVRRMGVDVSTRAISSSLSSMDGRIRTNISRPCRASITPHRSAR